MPPLKHNSVRDGLSDSDRFSDISSSTLTLSSEKQHQQQFVPNARINISQSTKRELDSNSVKKIADNLPGFSDWRRQPPLSPATSSPGSAGDERLPTTRRTPKKQQHHRNSSTTTSSNNSASKDNYSVIDYSNMKDYVSFTPNNNNSQQRNIRDIECDILSQPQPDSQSSHQLVAVSSSSPPPPPIRKQQRYTKPDGPKPDPQPDLRVVPRKTSSSYYSESSSSSHPSPSHPSNSQQHTSSTNRRRASIESIGEQPSISTLSTTNTERTKKFNNTKEATMYKYKLLYETMLLEVAGENKDKGGKNSSSINSNNNGWVELGEDVINENTVTSATTTNNRTSIVEHHNSSIANKSAFHVSNSSSMNASSPTSSLAITKQTSLYSNASSNITPMSHDGSSGSGKVNIPKTPTCTLVVDEMIDGLEVEEIMLDNNDDEGETNHHQSKTNPIDKKLGNSERRKKTKKKSRHTGPSSSASDRRSSKNGGGSSSRESLNRSSRGRSRGGVQRQSSMDEIVSIASYKSSNSTSSRRSEKSDRSSRSGRSSRSMSSHRSNRSNGGGNRKNRQSRSRSGSSSSRRLSESSSSSRLEEDEDDIQQDASLELSNKKQKNKSGTSVFSKIKKFASKVKDTLDELGGGIHKYKLGEMARYRVMKVPKKCRRLYDEDTRTVEVEIVVVHVDAVLEMPYYTIQLPDGQRKQTNYDNLMTMAEYKKIKASNQNTNDDSQEYLERGRSSSRLLRFPSRSRSRSSTSRKMEHQEFYQDEEENEEGKKKKERRPSSSRRRRRSSSSRGSRVDEEGYLSSSQRSVKSNTSQRSSKSNNSTTTRDRNGSSGGEGGGGRLRSNSSSGDGIIIPSSSSNDSRKTQQRQHQQRQGRPRSPSPVSSKPKVVSKHREEKEPEEEDHASVSDRTHRTTGTTNTRKQHNLSSTKVYV